MAEAHFVLGGHQLGTQQHPLSIAVYQPSRAHLEHRVRARVRALPNVEIVERSEAVGLIASSGRDRVTGARIHGANAEETLEADLVVDATGRAGRTNSWLSGT
jgi:2-polyprenyl-6-methoxyphenol hydroxylase-like FAD-dependent oxidoreductase